MAKQSGRRSLADLNAAQFITRIQPTRALSADETDVWCRILESWPDKHWAASDADLLTNYCATCVLIEKARKSGNIDRMEKLCRLQMSYATRLRITPQSRYDARATARHANEGMENDAADDALLGGGIWSNAAPN